MAKGPYTYEYSDEHGDYTIRKFEGTNIAYKIYDTYDGEKDTPEKAMRRSIEERKAQGKDVSQLEKRLKDTSKVDKADKPEKNPNFDEEKYGKFFDEEGQIKEGQMEAYLDEVAKNEEPKLEYKTDFHLEAPVNDFEAAQNYLSSDDMTQYIPDELKDVVKDVKWELDDEESGHISFKTTRELTAEESKAMSDWIDGQNSDGLGEGFEQQDFAISYYDPYSGDGPYTYDEYQREIENRYDNLEPSEYADYLSDDAIEQGIQSWMEENEVDHIETDEEYERVREEVLDDPESYIDWEDIDTAKNDYMRDNEDLQEDHWFNMSSMRGNKGYGQEQNEFKVSELETTASDGEYQKALDDLREYSGIAADQAKEANAPIEEIRNYTKQLKDDFEKEHAAGNRLTTEEFFNGGKTQYKSNELQTGMAYSIDYGNGVEGTAIYIGKDENGNNMFYDGKGVDGTFGFSDKFIDDRVKISDSKENIGLDYDAYIKLAEQTNVPAVDYDTFTNKTLTGVTSAIEPERNQKAINSLKEAFPNLSDEQINDYYDRISADAMNTADQKRRTFATENQDQLEKEYEAKYGKDYSQWENFTQEKMGKSLDTTINQKDKYLNRAEMMDVIDQWSSEGFEEGKYKSDYGKGVFHQKYASGQLEGYGGEEDDFVIREFDLGSAPEEEALSDLNDKLSKYGYKAEYLNEGTVHQDIKISKDPKAMMTSQSKNNNRNNVFEGYERALPTPGDERYIGEHNLSDVVDAVEEEYGLSNRREAFERTKTLSDEEINNVMESKKQRDTKIPKSTNETMNDKIREAATKKTRNKGIKTIAKEYYGEGWNKLSENQKQIWIERNESWLKSAVEAANKKKK